MKIATVGCSHAGTYTRNPWPNQIAKLLNSELISSHSSGAGIGIGVDKLCYILNSNKVDHVFFQAPADPRFCIGMNSKISDLSGKAGAPYGTGNYEGDDLRNGNVFHSFIMTLVNGNKRALNTLVEKRNDELWDIFDKIWTEYFFDSFYETRIGFIKHLVQVQNLCNRYETPYTIFTWHDFPWGDTNPLLQAWINQLDRKNIIPESAINFNKRHNRTDEREFVYKEFSSDGYHLNELGSYILAKDYILEFYKQQIQNKP